MKKRILWLTVDIMAAAFVLVIVWVADYKIPQKGVKAVSIENAVSEAEKSQNEMPDFNQKIQMGDTKEGTASLQKTCIVRDSQDWHKKYVDKFSDTVVATDTSYTSYHTISMIQENWTSQMLENMKSMVQKHLMYLRIFMWGILHVFRQHLLRIPMV